MSQIAVRPVEARVYTNEFRVYGLVHFRPNTGVAWLLNAEDRPHLPMTEVRMYRAGIEHPPSPDDLVYESDFVAIPKSSIAWIAGGARDDAREGMGLHARDVILVYPTYVLAGSFAMRPEVRLSDFVGLAMGKKSFLTLTGVRVLGPAKPGASFAERPVLQSHDFVTVDIRKVAGVLDARSADPMKAFHAQG
jgi:hypothetical protein